MINPSFLAIYEKLEREKVKYLLTGSKIVDISLTPNFEEPDKFNLSVRHVKTVVRPIRNIQVTFNIVNNFLCDDENREEQ